MSTAPDPTEIFDRAAREGQRRLDQSLIELVATSFIAGFTIVFGIIAEGIVHAAAEPVLGDIAQVAGALAFGVGLVFLVVGRTELFNENFFDPAAAAVNADSWLVSEIARLWAITFTLNLVGGVLFALVFTFDGMLPPGTWDALRATAEEISRRETPARVASGIVGGALVSMLSFLLQAVDTTGNRMALAYAVGFLLALEPFGHVVVTLLHVSFGILFGASIGIGSLARIAVITTGANLVGGLGLVTMTHVAQAKG